MSADLNDIRKGLDIVDVISSYINLERSGNNYRANCPFHDDKTPSFFVSPSRQIFKCFGCGVGGDAIKFVSLYENVPYLEAARELARRYKLKVSLNLKEEDRSVYSSLEEAAGFYQTQVNTGEVLDYLKRRGIGANTLRRFQIGYSPSNTAVVRFLTSLKLLEAYKKTKNLIEIDRGTLKDIFARRLVFPIRDLKGRVLGFGGGAMRGEEPKYINSPESEVFQKRKVLFGLHQALSYMKEFKEAVLVEGYFDVMRLHEVGVRNAVAPLGTSLTKEQALTLSRVVNRVFIMFDGDEAGRRATKMAIPKLLAAGLEVYPVVLPEGLDPDDAVSQMGKDYIKTLLKETKELFLSLLDEVVKVEDKESIIKDFVYYASFMKDEIKAYSLLLELSRTTNVPVSVLESRMAKRREESSSAEENLRLNPAERVFLKGLLLLKPENVDLAKLNLSPTAYVLAEKILRGDYDDVPRSAVDIKTENLEEEFEYAVKEELALKVFPKEEIDKERLRELTRQGGNRFRRRSV